jgi:hypothetical protein
MLSTQKRNSRFIVFLILFPLQFYYAQNQQIKAFFEDKKKTSYQDCIKESEIDEIKKTDENKKVIELMMSGCKDRGVFFNNFIDGTISLHESIPKLDDYIIFNWKKYDAYIPAPTVTLLQTDKTNVIEFTYYDEERNAYDATLRKKVYEEKEGKFKNELLYIQTKLNGEGMDDSIARYQRYDYYIIKRVKGKYFFYTLINDKLEQDK